MEQVRLERVPEVADPVPCFFGDISPLACIIVDESGKGTVLLHSILNHSRTPLTVMKLIATHELIHLVVPAERIDGKWNSHPPAFWEMENARCPEKADAWSWLHQNFRLWLGRDREDECIYVMRDWRQVFDPWGEGAPEPDFGRLEE